MFSKFLKTFLMLIVVIFLMWGFSDSYSSANIDNIAHITAIAIDKNNDLSAPLKVSFQFIDVSSSGGGSESSSKSNAIIVGINSNTIDNAINRINAYIGKQINLSHCRTVVFSQEFASGGIATEIYTLINNVQMRPSTNIVISTSEASSYLKNANPNVEELISKYYDTFELTSNFTGYSDDSTLGTFYDNMLRTSKGNTAILGETFKDISSDSNSESSSQSSSESQSSGNSSQSGNESKSSGNNSSQSVENSKSESGENEQTMQNSNQPILESSAQRGTQNVGIAVFDNDTFIGQLSAEESIYHLLVTNNIDSFAISVPVEGYNEGVLNFQIAPYKDTKVSIDTSSETPIINLTVFCEAYVLSIDKEKDYGSVDFIDNTSPIIEKYLKENISSYLNKTSEELKVDISNFYSMARRNFLTIPEWNNYNWSEKYKDAKFFVNINLNLNSHLLFIENQ